MTVLPTVRHQLEQAAERHAASRWRGRTAWSALRPRRLPFGAAEVIATFGVIVALGVAALAVVLLDHARTTVTPATPAPHNPPAARRLFEGNGIGGVRFGQPRAAVTLELERLLGPPHETIPGICGLGPTTDWIGLQVNSHDPQITAQLTLIFKHSRFVGYAYQESGERVMRRHQAFVLATRQGLTLGDTVARARQLYGRAFVETTMPQGTPPSTTLQRLPVGKVTTPSGQISAVIQGSGAQDRVTAQSIITLISAGAGPNTPCR